VSAGERSQASVLPAIRTVAVIALLVPAVAGAQVRGCRPEDAPQPYNAAACTLSGLEACSIDGTTLQCDLSRLDDAGCETRVGGTAWIVTGYGPERNAFNAWGALFERDGAGESFCCLVEADRNRPIDEVVLVGTCGDDAALSFTYSVGSTRYDLDAVDLVAVDSWVSAGDGDDVVEGSSAANSRLYRETLDGGEGRDRLFGHGGSDVLVGGPGVDSLRGGEGDDLLCDSSGGGGACDPGQELLGGPGDDLLHVIRARPCTASAPLTMDGGEGQDRCGDPGWRDRDLDPVFASCRANLSTPPPACPPSG
jgi:hypothetical protein